MAIANVLAAKRAGFTDEDIAQYLSEQSGADYQGAISQGFKPKDIINFLNKQDMSFGQAFMAGAKAEVGSELAGARQLVGGDVTEEEVLAENLARAAEEERGAATFLGRMAGGLINPSSAIPGTLLFKSVKGLIVGGSVGGGVSGFLRPIYTEEDMGRGASAVAGVALGAGLSGAIGGAAVGAKAISRRLGTKAAEVEPSMTAPKTVEEVQAELPKLTPAEENTLPVLLSKAPEADQKYVDNILSRYDAGDEIPYEVLSKVADDVEDPKLAALFRDISRPPDEVPAVAPEIKDLPFMTPQKADATPERAAAMEAGEQSAAKAMSDIELKAAKTGDYREYLKTSAVRFAEIRPEQFARMVAPDNPYKNANIKNLLSDALTDDDILTQVQGALAGRYKYEKQTGKTWQQTVENNLIPERIAVQAFSDRKVQELLGEDFDAAIIPAAQQAIADLKNAKELYRVAKEMGNDDAYAVISAMMTKANALLMSVEGNASNLGRALNFRKAFKKMVGGDLKNLRKSIGGTKEDIDAFYRGLDDIARMEADPVAKARMEAQYVKDTTDATVPKLADKVAEYVVNAYISGLSTIAVNAMSVAVKAPLAIIERALVSAIPGSGVSYKESVAMARGLFQGMAEGVNFAKAGWAKGSSLDDEGPTDYVKRAIGGLPTDPMWEQKLGKVVRVPTRASVATDEFSKAIFRRMQFNAMVERVAQEIPANKLGNETREQLADRLRQVNTGSLAWKRAISDINPSVADDIMEFSKNEVFQAKLGRLGNILMQARREYPQLVFILPFIKTPINIVKDALSYTPASLFMNRFKNRKNEAIARTMMGTALGLGVAQQIGEGNITGAYPKDAGERAKLEAARIPEYSFKLPGTNTWYSYARVEPLATLLGITTDGLNSVKEYYNKPEAEKKIQQLGVDMTLAITKNLTSKTFLEGVSGFLQAMHDPTRYGASYLNGFAGLVVPAAVAQFARIPDPYQRDVQSFGEAVQARLPVQIPGILRERENLPIKYDILGDPKKNPSYGVAGILGIANREEASTDVQREINRTGFKYSPPERKIRDVELSSLDYEQYSKLAGDRVNSSLNSLVQDPSFAAASEPVKAILLKRVAEKARKAATNQMFAYKMSTDPDFISEYRRLRLKKKGITEE